MKIKNLSWVVVIIAILFLSACTKIENVGEDVVELPGDQLNVVYMDTLSINAYSILQDSLRSDEAAFSTLGSYYDNVFGTSTCGFYTQLRLASNNIDFGTGAICDSVVLTLKYNSVIGDSLYYHNIKVYELTESIYKDSSYFINMPELSYNTTPIADVSSQLIKNDSVLIDGETLAPHLRIKLDNAFAAKIMAKSGGTELSSNAEFLEFIKGLYITVDKTTSNGSFAIFDLLSSLSQMTIYYRNPDTLKVNFIINSECARINVCNHYNYNDASIDFKNQVINHDTTLGNQTLYVQSQGGIGIDFKIPYLSSLTKDNKKIAIQKAELIVNAVPGSTSGILPISTLALVKKNKDGTSAFFNDLLLETSTFGGSYDSDKQQYSFVITRQLQKYISGEEVNYGFKILADYGLGQITQNASYNPNRLIANGPKTTVSPLKLKIIYTVVN